MTRSRSREILKPVEKQQVPHVKQVTATDEMNDLQLRLFRPWYRIGKLSFATWSDALQDWDVNWTALYEQIVEPALRAEHFVSQYRSIPCFQSGPVSRMNPATGRVETQETVYAEDCGHAECKQRFTSFHPVRRIELAKDQKDKKQETILKAALDCPLQTCMTACTCFSDKTEGDKRLAKYRRLNPTLENNSSKVSNGASLAEQLKQEDDRRQGTFKKVAIESAIDATNQFWDKKYEWYKKETGNAGGPEAILKHFWMPADSNLKKTRQELLQFFNLHAVRGLPYATLLGYDWKHLPSIPYVGSLL